MEFPSIFLFNSKYNRVLSDLYEARVFKQISIAFKRHISNRILLVESDDLFFLAHVNEAFRKKIEENSGNINSLIANIDTLKPYFNWGFFLIISKETGDFVLNNDPFGIYPLYYSISEDLIITNDLDGLIDISDRISLNILGLYDYFLFNYTLKLRTIFKGISQLIGGTCFEYKKSVLNITNTNYLSKTVFSKSSNVKILEMAHKLEEHINLNLDPDIPTIFPLTGGFDSKIILSLLLSQNINFSAVTFGKRGSDDLIAALSIADRYNLEHGFLEMTPHFIDNLDSHISEFIRCSPNVPMLDTLLNYQLTKGKIPASNFVTGIMGGEMIVGPVLISELITTRSSALLTSCRSENELLYGLERNVQEQGILNDDLFKENSELYVEPLLDYLKNPKKGENENVIRFLLNETYAKFFGVVFGNLFLKCNIINPLVDIEFLRLLFSSEYGYIEKQTFSKAPLSHFNSRRLYPELIKLIFPSVLKTKMDRGYYLEDFMKWYMFIRPFTNYFKRHYLKKRRKNSGSSSGYLEVLESLAIEYIEGSEIIDLEIFDKESILQLIKNVKKKIHTPLQKQKLLQLLSLCFIINRYGRKLNITS